jgi:hypothetical protein
MFTDHFDIKCWNLKIAKCSFFLGFLLRFINIFGVTILVNIGKSQQEAQEEIRTSYYFKVPTWTGLDWSGSG